MYQFLTKAALPALLAAGSLCAPAYSQTAMTLPDAVKYALAHSSTVASQQATLAQAEASFTKARAQQYPTVLGQLQNQIGRSSNLQGSLAQYGLSQVNKYSQNTAQISSNWTVYDGSLNQILTQEAKRQVESARGTLQATQFQLTNDVTAAFFAISSKDEAVGLDQDNLTYQTQLSTAARIKEHAGLIAGVDVLNAQSSLEKSQADLLGAQAEAANSRESLAQLIGAPLNTDFRVPGILPSPALPDKSVAILIATAELNRPDLAAALANLQSSRLQLSSLYTALRPQLSLNGAFGNQSTPSQYGSTFTQIQQLNALCATQPGSLQCIGFPFSFSRGSSGFWQVGAVASLSIPIIDWGQLHESTRAARVGIDSAQLAYDSAKSTVELSVRQSLRNAQTAEAQLAYLRDAGAAGTEAARIAQLQYKNGLISLIDTTQSQRDALSAELNYVDGQVAYITALVKLRTALGTYDPIAAVSDLR
ncbi:MAG: TolC family protein [Candidatus Baltobacteraceae bacterium]